MTQFLAVLRTSLDTTFGLSAARYRYIVKRQRLWEPILILWGLGTLVVLFGALVYKLAQAFVASGAVLGQPEVAFTFALTTMALLIFFFGLFQVLSMFFFSRDLDLLVPLPLRPVTIVGAKFATILVSQYFMAFLVLGLTAVAYAQVMGGGLLYWLNVLIVGLLAPIIPLAMVSVVALVLMRFINRRHRDLLMVLAGLLILVAVIAFQMFVARVPEAELGEYLSRIVSGQIRLVNLAGRTFPPAIWATEAITLAALGPRLLFLGAYAGTSAAALWLSLAVGERFFYAGLIGSREVARRRPAPGVGEKALDTVLARVRQDSVIRAVFWREWRLFMRMPLWVMNGLAGAVIVPVMFLIPALAASDPEMAQLLALLEGGAAPFYVALGFALTLVFVVGINTTSSTSVSREGASFWLSKVLPVRPEEMVLGKLAFSMVISAVSAIPVTAAFAIVAHPSAAMLVLATLAGLAGSVVVHLLGLLVDMSRPQLDWTNPQQAVKSNTNVIISMLVTAVFMGLTVLLGVALYGWLRLVGEAAMGVVLAVLIALSVPLYRAVVRTAEVLYTRRDV